MEFRTSTVQFHYETIVWKSITPEILINNASTRDQTAHFSDKKARAVAEIPETKVRYLDFWTEITEQKLPLFKLLTVVILWKLSRMHPAEVHAALGNKMRWEMMGMMADGKTLTAREASRTLRQDINTVMKHLRLLRRLGLIEAVSSEQDARYLFYHIPERWRPQPGVLDFGECVARFPVR